MKIMKRMPLHTEGSRQHLTDLSLEENEQKASFWFFYVFLGEFDMHVTYLFVNVAVNRWRWRVVLGLERMEDGVDGS